MVFSSVLTERLSAFYASILKKKETLISTLFPQEEEQGDPPRTEAVILPLSRSSLLSPGPPLSQLWAESFYSPCHYIPRCSSVTHFLYRGNKCIQNRKHKQKELTDLYEDFLEK